MAGAFRACKANEANFIDCQLGESDFGETDLTGANFEASDLSKANLATAKGVFFVAVTTGLLYLALRAVAPVREAPHARRFDDVFGRSSSVRRPQWLIYIAAVAAIIALVVGLVKLALWQGEIHNRERATVAAQNVAQLFDRELGDFETLATQVQLTRAAKGGYRLDAIAEGCFFERIGLKAGDIVRRIDGRPINGPSDASAAYAWLHIADQFTVDIERSGQPLRLHYAIAR